MSADFLFKINSFQKLFQECHQKVKQFGSRSGLILVETIFKDCLQTPWVQLLFQMSYTNGNERFFIALHRVTYHIAGYGVDQCLV